MRRILKISAIAFLGLGPALGVQPDAGAGAGAATDAETDAETEAVGAWLRQLTLKGAARQNEMLRQGSTRNEASYVVQSIADLDAPAAVKARFQRQAAAHNAGVKRIAAGAIPSVASLLAQTPDRVLPDAVLRERLPVRPARTDGTPLVHARLINTNWSGTRMGINATGLSRIYLMEGVGIIEFTEDSYRQGTGQIIQFEEALNATVGTTPAMATMEQSADGRGRADLSWVTPTMSYTLKLVTDNGAALEEAAVTLMQIAEGIR